jgi:hypothetical protein
MHATSGTDDKARVGDAFPTLELAAASGQLVTVPDPAGDYVHLGLPADFLIAPDGRITALKYGRHAYDQWTIDELLDHACPVSA